MFASVRILPAVCFKRGSYDQKRLSNCLRWIVITSYLRSPKLFTACLEMVMRKIKWKAGIIIDGEKLNHFRFADDIALFASNSTELKQMLRELENESKKVALTMNPQKTKYMRSNPQNGPQIKLRERLIEEVDHFVYLGQEIKMRHDMSGEISRRIRAGWECFADMKEVLTAKLDPDIRAKIFDTTAVKTITYGSET
ncbi:Putative uncharacterized transposon-derived protein F52C9.6 [Toxocara canis]|uniref:Uncharacterized transposon-derived protein F52C9.6 n=1 Tax=Toxocara canis TaxID=6265 RepID=A0A0B2VAE2_TOXCA|nr:Putative uncharacterized transposon-derived protein F52C9.6 [Toxocara canis]